MPARSDILRSYRELVGLIRRLPSDAKLKALEEARTAVRAGRNEANELVASDMHKALVARIGFLRMTLPRSARHRDSGGGRYVYRDGEVVEASLSGDKRATEGKLTVEEAMQKHKQLTKRQYFGREPPRIRPPF